MGGYVNDALEFGTLGFVDDPLGVDAAQAASAAAAAAQERAARDAIARQEQAAQRGQEFLSPFGQVGQQALGQLGILTDPQHQLEFLRSNPFLNLSLQRTNEQIMKQAAAGGRIGAGDTREELTTSGLLAMLPFLQNQQRNVAGLLDFGRGLATTQANVEQGLASQVSPLLTDIGNVQAAGIVAPVQQQNQLTGQLLQLGGTAIGAFSDKRLKKNITPKGEKNGHKWYSWEWNETATRKLGLKGSQEGVMAQEIEGYMPEAIKEYQGYKTVDYSMLGVL